MVTGREERIAIGGVLRQRLARLIARHAAQVHAVYMHAVIKGILAEGCHLFTEGGGGWSTATKPRTRR